MSSVGTSKGVLEIVKFGVYVAVPIVLMYTFANNSTNIKKFMGNVYGARPIRRWLERKVVTDISMMMVREEIDEDSIVCIDVNEDKNDLVYRIDKNVDVKTEPTLDDVIHLGNKRRSNDDGDIETLTKKRKIDIKNEVIIID